MGDLGVVHVVYAPFGLAPVRQFADSYRKHPAGADHTLILAFKGFADGKLPELYRTLFEGIQYRALIAPNSGFDLGSYFFAARSCEHHLLCFTNSSSTILGDYWLGKMQAAIIQSRVGLVGATGSYESHFANLREARLVTHGSHIRRILRNMKNRYLLRQAARHFLAFPNPHVRTNAFMIARRHLLDMEAGPFRNKEDCHRFESGRNSLTASILRRGLQVRVVDRQGCSWPFEKWSTSHTFRSGKQENLLIADNRTRDYEHADDKTRCYLAKLAWGVDDPI